ncbi:MAG: hypothetical protein ABR878_07535 [Roseiarcus sp.]|jgi:hypothetical protein
MKIIETLALVVLTAAFAVIGLTAPAQESPPANPITAKDLVPAELVMHATVELRCAIDASHISTGTAFIFAFFNQNGRNFGAIVTNKHVLGTLDDHHILTPFSQCVFTLTRAKSDGSADYSQHVDIVINDLSRSIIQHPDNNVDLAIVPVADLINKTIIDSGPLFFTQFDQSLIPDNAGVNSLTPLEDVITIGYPANFWDQTNNLPIFHRASTATAPYIEFQGRKEFVIDTTEWFGASGSPVLIYNPSGWVDLRKHVNNIGQSRIFLIGIVYAVAYYNIDGTTTIAPIPTSVQVTTQIKVPINASVCIDASRILDFEPILASMGYPVPPGYTMRSK